MSHPAIRRRAIELLALVAVIGSILVASARSASPLPPSAALPPPDKVARSTTTISAQPTDDETEVTRPVLVVGTVAPPAATPRVVLQRLVDGRWLDRGAALVDPATGWYGITLDPSEHTTYDLRVRSNGGSVVSPTFTVVVHARPTRITATASTASLFLGDRFTVSGTVVEPDVLRRVVLQRKVDGHWEDRGTTPVDQRTGRFSMTVSPAQATTYVVRMRSEGGTRFSSPMIVAVRHQPSLVLTYSIGTRGVVASNLDDFARHVAQTYADPRGWSMGGSIEFRRVTSGGDFTVVLADAGSMPSFGAVCDTSWSCHAGRYVVINDTRWSSGAPGWSLSLDLYRHMVVNHETGHWLGQGHLSCGGTGLLAPVMMQQSKATAPCVNNAWPLGYERSQVATRRGVPIYS